MTTPPKLSVEEMYTSVAASTEYEAILNGSLAPRGPANAVFIEGDLVGPVLLKGLGAGGRPTASSVVGDIVDLARSIHRRVQHRAAVDSTPRCG